MENSLIRFNCKDNWRWYARSEKEFNEGKCFIGVTSVLDCVTHQRLKNWFQIKTKKEQETILHFTADQGNQIHDMIEDDLNGVELVPPDEFVGAWDNWQTIKLKNDIVAEATELRTCSPKFGYAGTLDILGTFNGKMSVMDIKTGFYSVKAGWQIAAYKYALEESKKYKDLGMVGLQIHRDGKRSKVYEYEHYDACYTAFLSTMNIWRMLYWNKLKKMNWFFLEVPLVKAVTTRKRGKTSGTTDGSGRRAKG